METNICNYGNIHLIGVQSEYKDQTAYAVKKGLEMASVLLKYTNPVEVAVFDSEEWDVHSKLNLSAHARVYYIDIKICFYRKGLDVEHLFKVDLPATIYHELAHVSRINSIGYAENLLQDLIDEGVACYIEEVSGLGSEQPYIKPINNEDRYLDEAHRHFEDRLTSDLHSQWFYGSGNLPEWIGYRIGYLLVKKYIDTNKISVDNLVRLKAETIIK